MEINIIKMNNVFYQAKPRITRHKNTHPLTREHYYEL